MATMTHLKCHDLENDTRWTDKLTPKKNTFERLALHHVRDMDNYVQPGAHGIDGPQLAVTAVYTDGTEADVTVDFIRAGWRRWLEGDEYEYLDAVPLTHVSRRRRLEAFCAQGDEPTAEQEAELAAARLAELADMQSAEAATRPGAREARASAQPAEDTAPTDAAPAVEGQAAAVEPADTPFALEPAAASTHSLADMLAAVANLPQPERAPLPTMVVPAAEPDLSPAAVEAVHACLRALVGAGDLGGDTRFIAVQAGKESLSPAAARTCRKILDRHRELLPVGLTTMALGEVETSAVHPVAPYPVFEEPAGSTARRGRGRGRPPTGAVALTPAERNRSWRANKAMVSVELPGSLADRLRAARDARGVSMADLLEAALTALDREAHFRRAA